MKKFYPILIGVHDRFEKYKKCIKSILSCTEAKNTNLYIASDGPNSNEAIFKVKTSSKETNYLLYQTTIGKLRKSFFRGNSS